MLNRIPALLVMVLLVSPALQGQQPPTRVDLTRIGPQVGERIQDFRLRDQTGTLRTLESIMGPKGAMLVFSRSVDWCPYCKTQMVELQGRLAELKAKGLGVAVITYDPPAIMADFSRRRGITFPLLSDSGSQTIKAYGLLNTTVAGTSSSYGIPFPGTLMLDRQKRVTSRYFEDAFQERNTVSTILLKLGDAQAPSNATRIDTDHLRLVTYASDDVVAPGSLFSLVFDVTLNKGMHVYAPGAKGYKVIGITLKSDPLLVTRPVQFPASETYYFKPLDERVPVFQKPFRLMQTLAVDPAPNAGARLAGVDRLTITGTFEYQACDDRLCYPPRSLPISYTVKVRQLDRERASVPAPAPR